jgi:hypothetical protein
MLRNKISYERSEVSTAVKIHIMAFWVMTPSSFYVDANILEEHTASTGDIILWDMTLYNPVDFHLHFRGKHCLHFQGRILRK